MDMNHLIGLELTPGSQRFNLISKSDIRYVGTLHEINPEASTIALENVASFGTEGRRGSPAEEIPPSASVYEYIVFRGSDVKDISVAEDKKDEPQPEPPQVPDDPAILGNMSRVGPGQGFPPQQQPPQHPQVPPGYPQQPQLQGFYPPYGQRFGPGPPAFPPGPGFPPYGVPPGWYPPPGQGFPQGPGAGFPPQIPVGPPGQHQTPPGVPGAGPVNLPKAAAELQVGDKASSSKPASQNATPAPAAAATAQQHAPTPPIESKPSVTEAVRASTAAPTKAPPTGPKNARVEPAIPKPVIPAVAQPPPHAANAPGNNNNLSQQAAVTDATRAATAAVAAAMAKLPQPNAQKKPDASVENMTKQMNELRTHDGGNRPHRGGGGGGGYRGGRGGGGGGRGGQYQGGTGKKFEVPETDYDFETANARFNKQDMLKEAIGSGVPVTEHETVPSHASGEPEPETTAAATAAAETNDPAALMATYNRTSSFFDNISSEARDREEGTAARGGGREWRGEEEKRNIETFGQGSVDGYRGSYRGRGRGRGYGRGRGGYGRGYSRGRGGFRGRGQSTGVPALT